MKSGRLLGIHVVRSDQVGVENRMTATFDLLTDWLSCVGSASCFKYATTCDKPLAHVVNVSGRYDMNDGTILANLPHNSKKLEEQVSLIPLMHYTSNQLTLWLVTGLLYVDIQKERKNFGNQGDSGRSRTV
jgi:hypothetical protein